MPRYFFRLVHGDEYLDEDGDVLADDAAARRMALAIMHETLRSHADHILADGSYVVEAHDASGRAVWRLTMQGADPSQPDQRPGSDARGS